MKIYIVGHISAATMIALTEATSIGAIEDIEYAMGTEDGMLIQELYPFPVKLDFVIPRQLPGPIKDSTSRYNRRANRAARNNWRK